MAADVTNRETVRDALATLLETALTGSGNPAQAVYAYQVGDFGGRSPVVVVSSAGSERDHRTMGERYHNFFYLNVYVFVLYADPGTDWGEDNAEDRVDLLEKEIADVLMDNFSTDDWVYIQLDGRSVRDSVEIGGQEYIREVIPVRVEVYDG